MNSAAVERLRAGLERIARDGGVCLAFSGGTDSALLLAVLADMKKGFDFPFAAVMFDTPFQSRVEINSARDTASEYGVAFFTVETDVLSSPELKNNPRERCYICKKMLFEKLKLFASEHGLKHVMDGTNADDMKTYRPGLRALAELGIESPLAESGMTKSDVRSLASGMGLSAASKPSAPCLATRFPYGTELTPERLKMVAEGEEFLRSLGFTVFRLRCHGGTGRIEVPREDMAEVAARSEEISNALRKTGFDRVTLDLEGFSSGSMDRVQCEK